MITVHAVVSRGAEKPRALFLELVDAERFKATCAMYEVVPVDIMQWTIPGETFEFEGE